MEMSNVIPIIDAVKVADKRREYLDWLRNEAAIYDRLAADQVDLAQRCEGEAQRLRSVAEAELLRLMAA